MEIFTWPAGAEGETSYFLLGSAATAPGFQKNDSNSTSWVSYVMELTPDFQRVVYATFLGGTSPVGTNSMTRSIAVSPAGCVTYRMQASNGPSGDAFPALSRSVIRLGSTGMHGEHR